MTKYSPALNIPNKTLKTDKGSKLIYLTFRKPRTESYSKGLILQLLKGSSRDSISFLQKVHRGESIILKP